MVSRANRLSASKYSRYIYTKHDFIYNYNVSGRPSAPENFSFSLFYNNYFVLYCVWCVSRLTVYTSLTSCYTFLMNSFYFSIFCLKLCSHNKKCDRMKIQFCWVRSLNEENKKKNKSLVIMSQLLVLRAIFL